MDNLKIQDLSGFSLFKDYESFLQDVDDEEVSGGFAAATCGNANPNPKQIVTVPICYTFRPPYTNCMEVTY